MKKKPAKESLISTSGSIWNWWQPAQKNPVISLIPDNKHFMCLVAFQLAQAEEATVKQLQISEQ